MKHFVVAIGREFGSGGAEIGKLLAKKLGVRCYDRTLIDMAVEKTSEIRQIPVDGKILGKSGVSGVLHILFPYDYFFLNKFFFSF